MSVLLSGSCNAEVCFQPPSSLRGKVLALAMPFFVLHTPCVALEIGQDAGIVQIDFSAAFDRVNHGDSLRVLLSGSKGFCAICSDTISL